MSKISVGLSAGIEIEEYLSVMDGSGLAARRPYGDTDRLGAVLAASTPVIEARTEDGTLIGVARSISDSGFVTYLCDLAVIEAYQDQGIARDMVEATRDACDGTVLVVSAAPETDAFYDHLGLRRHHSTWYGLPLDLTGFPQPPAAV